MRANLHANAQLRFSILFFKYLVYMCAHVHVPAVPEEARRWSRVLWNWSYRQM